jgi:hypothetical protein
MKTFEKYVSEYIWEKLDFLEGINIDGLGKIEQHMIKLQFQHVPFEFRVGLLRYIVSETDINIFELLMSIHIGTNIQLVYSELSNLPVEFFNSFKNE